MDTNDIEWFAKICAQLCPSSRNLIDRGFLKSEDEQRFKDIYRELKGPDKRFGKGKKRMVSRCVVFKDRETEKYFFEKYKDLCYKCYEDHVRNENCISMRVRTDIFDALVKEAGLVQFAFVFPGEINTYRKQEWGQSEVESYLLYDSQPCYPIRSDYIKQIRKGIKHARSSAGYSM